MSTKGERAAKSRKPAAKVSCEFGAVGGIVIVGGLLVAGIAAAAIACLRRRSQKMLENEKPGEKSSENLEEVEPILEIADMEKLSVENFSPMDLELSANEKSKNRSKGDESPRSHLSFSGSFGTSASVSSDCEDLIEINQMSFKEPLEETETETETSGKASFDCRESECISGKEEAKVEYEESVDSFDGVEDCEEVGGERGNDCEESGESSMVCKEGFDGEKCVEFESGYKEDDKVCMEDDGSMHVEEFHVPIEGIDESSEGRIVEIDVLKVSGDLCVDREEKDQMEVDGKENTVLFNQEDLQEKGGGSEVLNCDKEECSEDVPRREGDSSLDFSHFDERGEHGEVYMSEKCFSPIQEQNQQAVLGTNQEVLLCKEECLQEKFESNDGRCGEENRDSEESDDQMVNVGYKEEQCDTVVSRDFEDLDSNGSVSHCEETCQHGDMQFSEETSCHTEEEIQHESVKAKEFESTKVDEYCCQDAAPHERGEHGEVDMSDKFFGPIQEQRQQEIVGTNQEVLFCKEECLQEKFESIEAPCGEENTDSDNQMVNVGYKEEQCGTVVSRDFEVLDYNGGVSHCEEKCRHGDLEFSEETSCHTEEEIQQESVKAKEFESTKVDEYCYQDAEDNTDSDNQMLNVGYKEEQCGMVVSRDFEDLDSNGGVSHCEVKCQHGELEFSEETSCHTEEEIQQESVKPKEFESTKVDDYCCQIGTVDCGNFGGLDENASHENVSCQYEAVALWELDDLNRDLHSEKGQFENERFNSKEDVQNEQLENEDDKVVSRDSEDLDSNGGVSHCEVHYQHGELEFSEETSCHTEEEIQQESVKPKEFESTEVDEYCCQTQDAAPHELYNVKEEVHLCKEKHLEEKTFESNVEEHLRERANSEEKSEERVEDLAHEGEQCQQGTVDSKGFEVLDYEGAFSHSEGSGRQKEEFLDQNYPPINETAQNEELECQEAEVNDLQVSVDVSEYLLPSEEQSIQEENLELNLKQCPQEKTDTEEDLKGCHVDTVHKGELLEHETVDFSCSEGLDDKGGSNNCNEVGQHGELEDSEETLFPINEQSQQETLQHKELDCREVEVPGHHDGHKSELDCANKEENFVSNVEQCSQGKTESEELNCIAAVAHQGEQCQIGKVDSGIFGGLDEDASHENVSCQYRAVGQWQLDDSNRDSHSEKGQFENERFNSKEDIQNEQFENGSLQSKEAIEIEQLENGRLNSKEIVELDIGLEEIPSLQEENIKQPQEALEVSGMEMESEENTVPSKETSVDGDAHIFKEEAMDSIESQNSVEDISSNHELCEGTTCELEESEFVEENMPIAQEEYKQEIVNSVDTQDSVESDELEGVAIPGGNYQGDAVYIKQLEPSGNLHSGIELCKQEERLGEQSPPSQEEIVALKETNDLEYLNQCKQSQQKEIDAKDQGYSSSIVLELSPNEPDCTEAYESSNEDPQTHNKPEVIGTKDSEYSSGDALEKEKYQLETVDQVYYGEDQEICPQKEEENEENSSTHSHNLHDQNEANQDISSTTTPESCKLLDVSKEFKLDDESADSKSVTPLESEPREVSNTNSVTEIGKKGWDPLHSSQLVLNSEEGKSLWMKLEMPLYMRTRIPISLFAALLVFLFAYILAKMLETVYAT